MAGVLSAFRACLCGPASEPGLNSASVTQVPTIGPASCKKQQVLDTVLPTAAGCAALLAPGVELKHNPQHWQQIDEEEEECRADNGNLQRSNTVLLALSPFNAPVSVGSFGNSALQIGATSFILDPPSPRACPGLHDGHQQVSTSTSAWTASTWSTDSKSQTQGVTCSSFLHSDASLGTGMQPCTIHENAATTQPTTSALHALPHLTHLTVRTSADPIRTASICGQHRPDSTTSSIFPLAAPGGGRHHSVTLPCSSTSAIATPPPRGAGPHAPRLAAKPERLHAWGPHSVVYIGTWQNAQVAVKYVLLDSLDEPGGGGGGVMEALLGPRLQHPAVVQCFESRVLRLGQHHFVTNTHSSPATTTTAMGGGGGSVSIAGQNNSATSTGLLSQSGITAAAAAAATVTAAAPTSLGLAELLRDLHAHPGQYLVEIVSELCCCGNLRSMVQKGSCFVHALGSGGAPPPGGPLRRLGPASTTAPTAAAAWHGRSSNSSPLQGVGGGGAWLGGPCINNHKRKACDIDVHAPEPEDGGTAPVAAAACSSSLLEDHARSPLPPISTAQAQSLLALVRTAAEVAQGMSHLHSCGVLHGDLKPDNILLQSSGRDERGWTAKVADFGLAQVFGSACAGTVHALTSTLGSRHASMAANCAGAASSSSTVAAAATGTGQSTSCRSSTSSSNCNSAVHTSDPVSTFGAIAYQAPEAVRGQRTLASDVWSFGMLLYFMVTGRSPYRGTAAARIYVGLLSGGIPLEWPAGLIPHLRALGGACTFADQAARPTFETIIPYLVQLQRLLVARLTPQS